MENWEVALHRFRSGEINGDQLDDFFPVELRQNKKFVLSEIQKAVESRDSQKLDFAIELLWLYGNGSTFLDTLNDLLVNPNHTRHQQITMAIQQIKSPTSIPYIEQVLKTGFGFLEYTGSESGAIAKWFSHALQTIGTDEAIALIEKYSHSDDPGIRDEMLYRLKKIADSQKPITSPKTGFFDSLLINCKNWLKQLRRR